MKKKLLKKLFFSNIKFYISALKCTTVYGQRITLQETAHDIVRRSPPRTDMKTTIFICFKISLNQFQIVSSTLGNQTATILMIFRVRKSNFGSPDLKFHIFISKIWIFAMSLYRSIWTAEAA